MAWQAFVVLAFVALIGMLFMNYANNVHIQEVEVEVEVDAQEVMEFKAFAGFQNVTCYGKVNQTHTKAGQDAAHLQANATYATVLQEVYGNFDFVESLYANHTFNITPSK